MSLYSSGLRETRVRVELQCLQENGTLALVNDDDIPTGKLMWSSQATDITFWFISFLILFNFYFFFAKSILLEKRLV